MNDLNYDGNGLELPPAKWTDVMRGLGLTRWNLRWLAAAAIIWLAYQIAYLAWDLRLGPASESLVALHLPNFLIVAGTSSWLLISRKRHYWHQVLFGAAFGLSVWTLGICLRHGTPMPLLTTLLLMILMPGALAPWRWYWTGACSLTGVAAILMMESFMKETGANWLAYWDDYWLILALAIAAAYAAAVARELRHTRRGFERLQLAERRLISARSELHSRISSLQLTETRLREEIEERQRAEARASNQESFLRAFFDASPDMIGITSMPDGRIIDFNPRYQASLGIPREKAMGMRIMDTGVVAKKEQFDIYAAMLIRDGGVSNYEMELRDGEGTVKPFLVSAVLAEVNGRKCALALGHDISGVRQAQDMLRTVVQSMPDAMALTSWPDGRVVYCNNAYEVLRGTPKESLIGQTIFETGVWARWAEHREYVRLIRAQGTVQNLEVELRSADGTIGSWLLSGTMLEIQGKEYILSTSRDIGSIKRTERELVAAREELKAQVGALRFSEERLREEARGREEVEHRLRQSEAMFRKVFDTSLDIIGINSVADGRFIAVNRSHLEFTGQFEKDILGRSALDLNIWEDRTRASEYLRLLRRDGAVHGFEANLRRWDGTLVPIIISAIVVDIDGEPCIVAIGHDISSRIRSETILLAAREELARQLEVTRDSEHRAQESESILRTIFDASPNSTSLIRLADGKHLMVNKATTRLYGYSLEECLQRSNQDLHLWAKRIQRVEYLRRLHDDGSVRDMEAQMRAKDGRVLTMLLSAERVEVGGQKCIVAISTDVTAAKRIEAELVAAREEAVAASEAKSSFLSSMSHEIRTPMNAMLGMADLLWETPLTAEQRRFLDSIRRNSNALLDLINGILDLAKVESGRLSLEWIAFDLRELTERVVETLGVKAHQKWVELAARIAPAVPTELVGDPLRLRQILMNLIGNAIKFTEHGEVALEIESCVNEPPHSDRIAGGYGAGKGIPQQHHVRFVVRDTGIGIDSDRLDGIFATFTQAESSTARKYGGSGLGLAIVKGLVEVMGGTLSVKSEPGQGSVFSFIVPFQLPPKAETMVNPAAPWLRPALIELPKSTRMILPHLGGRRVLVTDDTLINRTSLREMLEARGARVDEAANGQSALTMVTKALEDGDAYALALIDGRMPGLDGVETARRLLRDDEMSFCCGAVILMVTSDALNPTLARCRQAGIDRMRSLSYVVKPVRMTELAEAIKQVIVTDGTQPSNDPRKSHKDRFLPMTAANGSANGSKSVINAPASVANGKTQSLKVLLAEDSPDNCMLIEAYFKGTNYALDVVENGERAVERFTHGVYDAVLMDIHMPVMDGYTATRQIRAWEKANARDRTPVMALTASAQDEAVQESLAAGCDSHLAKPIRRATLLQAIDEIIGPKNSGENIEAVQSPAMAENKDRNVVQIDADLSDLVPNFLAHKRDDARTIAVAIEMDDYATLSQLGHKLKGEGGSYGFDAITAMGAALEDAAKIKDQIAARHWSIALATFLDTLEVVYA